MFNKDHRKDATVAVLAANSELAGKDHQKERFVAVSKEIGRMWQAYKEANGL
jgi:hypothetical protein